jgi:hypothetical protein
MENVATMSPGSRRHVTYANFKVSLLPVVTRLPGCYGPCPVVQCGERPGEYAGEFRRSE